MAKGYKQKFGVDYSEVFAPVARLDRIRLVIALTAQLMAYLPIGCEISLLVWRS